MKKVVDILIIIALCLGFILVGNIIYRANHSSVQTEQSAEDEQVVIDEQDTLQWCRVVYDDCYGTLVQDPNDPQKVRYLIQDAKTMTNHKMELQIRPIDNFDSVRAHAQDMHQFIVERHLRQGSPTSTYYDEHPEEIERRKSDNSMTKHCPVYPFIQQNNYVHF